MQPASLGCPAGLYTQGFCLLFFVNSTFDRSNMIPPNTKQHVCQVAKGFFQNKKINGASVNATSTKYICARSFSAQKRLCARSLTMDARSTNNVISPRFNPPPSRHLSIDFTPTLGTGRCWFSWNTRSIEINFMPRRLPCMAHSSPFFVFSQKGLRPHQIPVFLLKFIPLSAFFICGMSHDTCHTRFFIFLTIHIVNEKLFCIQLDWIIVSLCCHN